MNIELLDIEHSYTTASGRLLPALSGVRLSVRSGEFLAVVGPSGCGKTTLLRLISRLEIPTAGRIRHDEVRPGKIAFVFQRPVLLSWRTVWENLSFPTEIANTSTKDHLERLLDLVGLDRYRDLYPHELSGGMQARVALGRALAQDPRLLLLDEPFSALDELSREQLNLELLRLHHTLRLTTIFVTHNIQEAVLLADRVCVLSPQPASVQEIVPIALPRPRTSTTVETHAYQELVLGVRRSLRLHGLPRVEEAGTASL